MKKILTIFVAVLCLLTTVSGATAQEQQFVTWEDVPAITIQPNTINNLVFQFTTDKVGDSLEAVALQYTGLAPKPYIRNLRLWQDDGDGIFEGYGKDFDLGKSFEQNGKYFWQELALALDSKTDFYVTLESGYRQDINTVQPVSFKLIEVQDINNDGKFDSNADWGIFFGSGVKGPKSTYQTINSIKIINSPIDATKPLAVITSHEDGQQVLTSSTRIEGTAVDSGGGSVSAVKLVIDNVEHDAQTGDGFDNWFFDWSGYTPGIHNIKVQAIDNSNNKNFLADEVNLEYVDRVLSKNESSTSINKQEAKANGSDSIDITVITKDEKGTPFPGVKMDYEFDGEEPDVVTANVNSDGSGIWTLTLKSVTEIQNTKVTIFAAGVELESFNFAFANDVDSLPPVLGVPANSGDLIKASGDSVYYLGADGKRYVFPDQKTYLTWYSDFDGIVTLTDEELGMVPIGGNVTYKPGTRLVKITTDPKVYAVASGGVLRWIETEQIAINLYGSGWASLVQDVADPFFVNYEIGDSIGHATIFNVSDIVANAESINVDKGL